MKKALKLLSLVLAVMLMLSLFAGCTTKDEQAKDEQVKDEQTTKEASADSTEKKQEPVTLRYYTNSATDKLEFDEAIPKWDENNPDINVECVVIAGADAGIKIKTAIAGGEEIDVCPMDTATFRDKADKLYYKLNDLMKNDNFNYIEEFGNYSKATMLKDDIYGMAKILAPAAIWINKVYFDQAGIPIPDDSKWTFDDYFDIMKELTIRDADGNVDIWGGMMWQKGFKGILEYACYGGWDIVTPDGKPNIYDPVLRKAVQAFCDAMFIDKSMPKEADVQANKIVAIFEFFKGNMATLWGAANSALFMDVFKMGGNLSEELEQKDAFKLLNMPRFDETMDPNPVTSIVVSYSVTSVTKHPQEAYKFLKWHCTDCLVESSKVAHRLPAWNGGDIDILAQNWRYYKNKDGNLVQGEERYELFKKALDPNKMYITFNNQSQYTYSSKMLEELKKEISLVLAGEKGIDDALQAAQKACESIYKKEKIN